ncbi:MAG: aldolase/citrate lyase family protein [Pseudolabrys sp.]
MPARKNTMKQAMLDGKLAVSLTANRWRSVEIASIAALTGYEWLFIDLEHGVMSEDQASQIAIAGIHANVTPIVRVGIGQFSQASRLLDAGMQGITFPHIETLEDAERTVEFTKYAPDGRTRRLSSADAGLSRQPRRGELLEELNTETLNLVMIESPLGVRNIDDIASVPGLDGIQVGTNDLSISMGLAGNVDHPDVVAACAEVARATRKHGKFFGMGGVYTAEAWRSILNWA